MGGYSILTPSRTLEIKWILKSHYSALNPTSYHFILYTHFYVKICPNCKNFSERAKIPTNEWEGAARHTWTDPTTEKQGDQAMTMERDTCF